MARTRSASPGRAPNAEAIERLLHLLVGGLLARTLWREVSRRTREAHRFRARGAARTAAHARVNASASARAGMRAVWCMCECLLRVLGRRIGHSRVNTFLQQASHHVPRLATASFPSCLLRAAGVPPSHPDTRTDVGRPRARASVRAEAREAGVEHPSAVHPDHDGAPHRAGIRSGRGALDREAHHRSRSSRCARRTDPQRRSGISSRRRSRSSFGGDLLGRASALVESLLGDLFSIHTSIRLMEHAATLDLAQFEDPDVLRSARARATPDGGPHRAALRAARRWRRTRSRC